MKTEYGEKKITAESIWKEYEKMLGFNESIQLEDTVRVNENFFIGKQWEGVASNGLPTPQFNFLKRVTLFIVASVVSDHIKLKASPTPSRSGDNNIIRAANVINSEFDLVFERNKIANVIREFMRNAAVDGDGATYTWWDPDVDAGDGVKGAIVTEIVDNTRVGFGNTADRRVQSQPYILIKRREMTNSLRKRAKKLGCKQWEEIKEDTDEQYLDPYKDTGDKTTVILRLWKDDKTKTVWGCECVRGIVIREPWDLGLKLYPITWLPWDYVQDNYHGQAMITGLVPNQIYINKLFAMSMISLMATAYPKIVYDKTRIPRWDNGVGKAIGVAGGGVDNVARVLGPAQISPQIAQFIELTQEMTQSALGATSVALGETRPDNTSAIIALQRAASTPNEITKQNLYQSIEDLGAIYVDFMGEYYGKRKVEVMLEEEIDPALVQFASAGLELTPEGKLLTEFDFSTLKDLPMQLKLDVGASAYWSEIASTQTLDNLLQQGHIDVTEYLERIPDGYITDRQGLIKAINERRARQATMAAQTIPGGTDTGGGDIGITPEPPEQAEARIPVRGGAGNGELQRALSNML